MAAIGWMMTWSGQVETWMGEGEAWVAISPAHPSPAGLRLGREGWWEASFGNPFWPEKESLGDRFRLSLDCPNHQRDPRTD